MHCRTQTTPGPAGFRKASPEHDRGSLDSSIPNASVLMTSRSEATKGIRQPEPVLLPCGTRVCRIGHRSLTKQELRSVKPVKVYRTVRTQVPEHKNFESPWWILEPDFNRIARQHQADPAWAARVLLAIAESWGGDCALQISATLTKPLYAWRGSGHAVTLGTGRLDLAHAVPVDSPDAYWIPDPDIMQLYIPGLKSPSARGSINFAATVLNDRAVCPLLPAGIGQIGLQTGRPFLSHKALRHDAFRADSTAKE
jgi:hypothetical protein